jgi:hypothetical protein
MFTATARRAAAFLATAAAFALAAGAGQADAAAMHAPRISKHDAPKAHFAAKHRTAPKAPRIRRAQGVVQLRDGSICFGGSCGTTGDIIMSGTTVTKGIVLGGHLYAAGYWIRDSYTQRQWMAAPGVTGGVAYTDHALYYWNGRGWVHWTCIREYGNGSLQTL